VLDDLLMERGQNVSATSAYVDYSPGQDMIVVTVGPNGGQSQAFGFSIGVSFLSPLSPNDKAEPEMGLGLDH
jgi:hypothetical protein